MKNIVLIGMPGAGKSTIGVLLAKSMLMDFVDTDLILQRHYGAALCDIIEKDGVESFIEAENKVISGCDFSNCVVATGGSAVYGEDAMKKLKETSVAVYLSVSAEELERRVFNIKTRGIAMKKGTSLAQLFEERKALYEKYADFVLQCDNMTAEECVNEIARLIKG